MPAPWEGEKDQAKVAVVMANWADIFEKVPRKPVIGEPKLTLDVLGGFM